MWPGAFPDDDGPGSAAGSVDWPVRYVAYAGGGGAIEVTAASTGKPFMALIAGRDPTYVWQRQWLKPRWEFPAKNANPAAIVRLVLPVSNLGRLPAALDIRWGPATGGTGIDPKTGTSFRYCAYRALFIMDAAGLRQATDQHVTWLLDEGIVKSGPPRRPPGSRPVIRFDEEV